MMGGIEKMKAEVKNKSNPSAMLAFPPDMLIMTTESFLSFAVDVLVGAKNTDRKSDMI